MLEVGEFFYTEHALLPAYDHAVVKDQVEDLTKVDFVLLFNLAGKKNVIEIGKNKGDAPKNTIHQPLECLGSILKPKGCVEKLPEPEGSDDGIMGMSANAMGIWW